MAAAATTTTTTTTTNGSSTAAITTNGGSSRSSANDTHPLQHTWELYLHYPSYSSGEAYSSEAYKPLCEFSTVEGFWHYYSFIPTPADVFTELSTTGANSLIKRKLDGKSLEAFGLFKKGVRPEWEDATNKKGGHWECRRPFDLATLDKLWNAIVLGLIGESLEAGGGGHITGARVVDKSKNNRPEYRLELWTSTKDSAVNDAIRDRLVQALKASDGDSGDVDFGWKVHADALEALPTSQQQPPSSSTTAASVGSAGKEMLMAAMGVTNGGGGRPASS